MRLKNYQERISKIPEEISQSVELSMKILDRIHELLDSKFDGKQKLLADRLGKSEAEVSKWLSGIQNFTIKTIAKLEAAFGEPIIAVCVGADTEDECTFEQVFTPYCKPSKALSIDGEGCIKDNIKITNFMPLKKHSNKKFVEEYNNDKN